MSTGASDGYEPGTVAALSIGGEDVRGIVREGEWLIVGHSFFKSIAVGNGTLIQSVRPLVVLDLDGLYDGVDMGGWEYVVDTLRKDVHAHATRNKIADQIEQQIKPPRIPEPGLWGVVEAGVKQHDQRLQWVRLGDNYRPNAGDEYDRLWSDLIDPVVIRPGIEDPS